MKFYITEEIKKELEAKIAELENGRKEHETVQIGMFDSIWAAKTTQAIDLLNEILSEAVVLPVEESWEDACWELPFYIKQQLENNFSTGVIIHPKQ